MRNRALIAIRRRSRRGLTILETLCTLIALVVGIGVGLVVLRGGWPSLARTTPGSSTAVESAPAAEPSPVELSAGSVPPSADQPAADSSNGVNAELLQQLRELRREVASLRADRKPSSGAAQEVTPLKSSKNSRPPTASRSEIGRRTLDFWNQMNRIMEREEAMRSVPFGGLTRSNAGEFMQRRDKAGRFAVAGFDELDNQLVDPAAVALARDIRDWYAQGVELNQQGSELQRSNDAQAKRGAAGKSWGDATKQHNQSVAELNRLGDRLQEELTQKYGLTFPDLR